MVQGLKIFPAALRLHLRLVELLQFIELALGVPLDAVNLLVVPRFELAHLMLRLFKLTLAVLQRKVFVLQGPLQLFDLTF